MHFNVNGPIISGGIGATLFEDEDGKVYFTYGAATRIALMKDDMSGFAGPFEQLYLMSPIIIPIIMQPNVNHVE